ncbi:MAG TPA: hypothetical protein VNW04_21630 [Puia sp.]|nr:hypothetical protein [Puia sp.]
MSTGPHIRFLRRQEIDISRWDDCISRSPNGWIFLRSFFLDAWGPWDALVAGSPDNDEEYAFVMPLPKKRKYGLTYTHIPPLPGQLGIAGILPVTATLVDDFLRGIPPSFKLVDTILNEQDPAPTLPGITITPRTNYVLNLSAPYPVLYAGYNGDAKKNLRQAYAKGLTADSDIPVDTVIGLYRAAYGELHKALSAKEYEKIARLFDHCIAKGLGFTLGIRDPRRNLHAAAFFALDEKRIYYLLGAPGADGRRYNAVHCLIDQVLKKYAPSGLELDFEGSDIPSVAAFYRKFNPRAQSYYQVKFNRFPNWMQRFL